MTVLELFGSDLMMSVSVEEEALSAFFSGAAFFTVAFLATAFFAGFFAVVFLIGFFVVM